jgi:hypothetical protein
MFESLFISGCADPVIPPPIIPITAFAAALAGVMFLRVSDLVPEALSSVFGLPGTCLTIFGSGIGLGAAIIILGGC